MKDDQRRHRRQDVHEKDQVVGRGRRDHESRQQCLGGVIRIGRAREQCVDLRVVGVAVGEFGDLGVQHRGEHLVEFTRRCSRRCASKFGPSRSRGARRCASQSCSTPPALVAVVSMIGGRHSWAPRSSICSRSRRVSRTPARSALLMTKTSATSRSPALLACIASPQPGLVTTTVVSARRRDLDLHLTNAHRLDEGETKVRRAEHAQRVGHRERESAEVSARRHGTNEDAFVGRVVLHAHAVAQDRPAGVGRTGIDAEHAHLVEVAVAPERTVARD